MIAIAGHTLQLGEQDEYNRQGAVFTRVTLECTCGARFASELVPPHPSGSERARIRARGWPASQEHLKTVSAPSAPSDVSDPSDNSPNPS